MTGPSTEDFSEIQSNWMKFDTVGSSIMGTLAGTFDKEWSGALPDQTVYQLVHCTVNGEEQPKGDEWNVGIRASNSYVHSRMNKMKVGQRVKFAFEKEIPPKQKGYSPAKSIVPYAGKMDESFTKKENTFEAIDSDDVAFDTL